MKFGLCLPIRLDASAQVNVEIAQKAEELGFDSIWVSDHIVMPERHRGMFSEVFYEPFTLLTYIAAATSKISVGTSVIILPYRNPVVVAKQITTLDILSGGRVMFGIGPGWMREEFNALSVPFNVRGKMTDEYIDAIRELWVSDSPSFKGNFVSYDDIKFEPKPLQKPNPPIIIAGSSEFALKRAALHGDGWQPTWVSPEDVELGMLSIKLLAHKEERDLSNFVWSVRNRIKLFKSEEEKQNYLSNQPEGAPYALLGTPEKINELVSNYKEIGITHLVFDPAAESAEEIYGIIEIISNEIMPHFK